MNDEVIKGLKLVVLHDYIENLNDFQIPFSDFGDIELYVNSQKTSFPVILVDLKSEDFHKLEHIYGRVGAIIPYFKPPRYSYGLHTLTSSGFIGSFEELKKFIKENKIF